MDEHPSLLLFERFQFDCIYLSVLPWSIPLIFRRIYTYTLSISLSPLSTDCLFFFAALVRFVFPHLNKPNQHHRNLQCEETVQRIASSQSNALENITVFQT